MRLILSLINFISVATRWLCNKIFAHFNIVSSDVLWGLWIKRNNLVFNKVIWINIKQVWRLVYSLLRDWKKPFRELEGGKITQFMDHLLVKLNDPVV
jgi:hypothetical protein